MYVRPVMPYQPSLHGMSGFGTPPYRGKGVWVRRTKAALRGLGDENMTIMPRNVIWDPASLNYKPHGYYTDPANMRPVGPYQNQPGNIPQPFSRAAQQRNPDGGPAGLSAYAVWGSSNRKPLYPAMHGLGTEDTSALLNKRQQAATKDQNPTNYASPYDSIAAGLNPGTVNAGWASALAKFPTMKAAIAAGIAPAVVIQYWNLSRGYRVPLQGMGQDPTEIDPLTGNSYGSEAVPGSIEAAQAAAALNQLNTSASQNPTFSTTGTYSYAPLYDPYKTPAGMVAAAPGGAGASGGGSIIPNSQFVSASLVPAPSPALSSNTLLMLAAGVAGLALIGGGGSKRRR
jgi:hypothetical protein